MSDRYQPQDFEERWMREWDAQRLYAAGDDPGERPHRFIMEMFPYPSGDLHMGHVENYTISDAMARYWRMQGFDVMHPMGYDAFGLPAENAAIKRNVHPREWTSKNIAQMRSSFKRLGFSYDWDREVVSCDPDYYKWNQWIFLKMFESGLAYRRVATQFWCPVDKTVLANEQMSTGVCWRCGTPPEIRELPQWALKITDYSDRLLDDMQALDWPDSILNQQRNWIGRSHGAQVTFKIKADGSSDEVELEVFTTRPDTLWGATFLVLAAEHPLAASLSKGTEAEDAYNAFVEEVTREAEVDRLTSKVRRGLALPATAVNPVNGDAIPIWVSDYVLMGYGTGAIMAVPGHDQRDFEFAKTYGLPVKFVIKPSDGETEPSNGTEPFIGAGVMMDSGPFDGTAVSPEDQTGITEVVAWLEAEGKGRGKVNYRQRDWGVSRQRYWGTPIPIIYCDNCGTVPVPFGDLPVLLPDEVDYETSDDAVSPLANDAAFVEVKCPSCGAQAKRETDTLDTFFDSSWYFLRYCDPKNVEVPFDPAKVAAWAPVDRYIGGTEHAVMHLIYARFFVKAFQDMGLVDFSEPFLNLFNQGSVSVQGKEMSSSKGNAIEAAEVISRFGADAGRMFMLFCSPPEADYDFPADGMQEIGRVAFGWLSRVWRILENVADTTVPDSLDKMVHRTIKAVTKDFEDMGFNTAIARLMELLNEFSKLKGPVPKEAALSFLKMLAPIAPFIAEELWHKHGQTGSIHVSSWPQFDESKVARDKVMMIMQVNGKVRDRIEVDATIGAEEMERLAMDSDKVKLALGGDGPQRFVSVPPKLINLVTAATPPNPASSSGVSQPLARDGGTETGAATPPNPASSSGVSQPLARDGVEGTGAATPPNPQ
ncbi:MAG: leucine--tRNA ligase [Actinomycetota bacterium]|nr:leucine--tRNA ligase [Actinomycetota bacterium]